MLSIKNIILVLLLGVCIFLLFKMYSHTSQLIDNAKNFITENLEEQFEEINEKFQAFEENLDSKFNVFGKKIIMKIFINKYFLKNYNNYSDKKLLLNDAILYSKYYLYYKIFN